MAKYGERRASSSIWEGEALFFGLGAWIAALVVDEGNVAAPARAIADNWVAELATWDEERLAQLLHSIREAEEIDLTVTGFSQSEIEQLLPLDIPEDELPRAPRRADD
jgi:hypothetical protein